MYDEPDMLLIDPPDDPLPLVPVAAPDADPDPDPDPAPALDDPLPMLAFVSMN